MHHCGVHVDAPSVSPRIARDNLLRHGTSTARARHAASQQPATRPCRDPQVLPVFLFDPRQYRRTARGCDKTGPFRAKFLYESVLDLRQQLRGIGSDLLVGVGKPEELLPRLVRDRAEIEPRSSRGRDKIET